LLSENSVFFLGDPFLPADFSCFITVKDKFLEAFDIFEGELIGEESFESYGFLPQLGQLKLSYLILS
jgi:hypothetical protein